MSVRFKKGVWYYEFMKSGKRYNGTCKNCRTEKQAKLYEKQAKDETAIEANQADIVKYHEQAIIEAQGGNEILLSGAFAEAMEKPSARSANTKTKKQNEAYFADFVAFAKEKYQITTLQQVRKNIAEEYIAYVRDNGRYIKGVSYKRGEKTIETSHLSKSLAATSLNKIHKICKRVFTLLADDGGITKNPFENIPMVKNDYETREIFTEEEREQILSADDDFCVPLFRMAFYSGLREGDVCNLKWENIDFKTGFISLKMNKTSKTIIIPILDRDWLWERYQNDHSSPYVFPVQFEMYQKNPIGVTYRIKRFLDKLGIVSSRMVRGKNLSVKDFHSCRHTFAVICCERGIPLTSVQNALGHSSPIITEIYTAHIQKQSMQKEFEKFSLSENKNTKHGFYNILKFQKILLQFQTLNEKEQFQMAYMLSEKLTNEELDRIFLRFNETTKTQIYSNSEKENEDFENFLMENAKEI